jgi:hypothetical protein
LQHIEIEPKYKRKQPGVYIIGGAEIEKFDFSASIFILFHFSFKKERKKNEKWWRWIYILKKLLLLLLSSGKSQFMPRLRVPQQTKYITFVIYRRTCIISVYIAI